MSGLIRSTTNTILGDNFQDNYWKYGVLPHQKYLATAIAGKAKNAMPSKPQPPGPPPAPTVNEAEIGAQQTADELRRRRGMAATILAGQPGDTQPAVTAAKLLGS